MKDKRKEKKRKILLDYGYSGTGDSACKARNQTSLSLFKFSSGVIQQNTKKSFLFRKNQVNDIIQ